MKQGIVRDKKPALSSSISSPLVANVPPPVDSSESVGMGIVNDNYVTLSGDFVVLSGDLVTL